MPHAMIAGQNAAEIGVLRLFLGILQREQAALSSGETESLAALAEEKLRYAEQIASINRERDVLLQKAGMRPGRDGLMAWRDTGKLTDRTKQDLVSLVELAKESQRLNDLNGKLVNDRLQHNQQALGVLLSAAKRTTFYGPDGQTRFGSAGRNLGSA